MVAKIGRLPGIRVLRRDRLAQVGTVGELARRCTRRQNCSRVCVGLRARPVEVPAPQVLLEQRTAGASVPAGAATAARTRARSSVGEVALALRDDPARLALEQVELLARSAAIAGTICVAVDPVPTTATVLPVRSCSVLPPRGVELGPGEVVEPRPVGIPRHVEEAGGAHEHVALVDGRRCRSGRVQMWRSSSHVAESTATPSRRCDRSPNSSTVSSRYFCSSGCLACVRDQSCGLNGKQYRCDATSTSAPGYGVVPPRAADPERLLVDRERVDAGPLQLHARRDPAEAGADDDDLRRSRGTEQLLGGGPRHDVMIGSRSQPASSTCGPTPRCRSRPPSRESG